MSSLTSHLLDVSLGQPARGVTLRLEVLEGVDWRSLGVGVTDADGRAGDLLAGAPLEARTYRLTFETGAYFASTGRRSFYPRVEVTFEVAAPAEHHHVPLLLSPFGYSTYRGSWRPPPMTLDSHDDFAPHLEALGQANRAWARRYPGDPPARQPIHTVYGGAHLYKAETTRRLGELALRQMARYAPDAVALARGVGFVPAATFDAPGAADATALRAAFESDAAALRRQSPQAWLTFTVYDRVLAKLRREAVEDFRIDFEDGYGARPDADEDATAVAAAGEVARGLTEGLLPPFLGIRIKSFGAEWQARGARTLEIFVDTLVTATGGRLPDNFVITLPKVTIAEQPRTLVRLCERLEARHGLPAGALRIELMIETTQALLGPDGRSPLPAFLEACEGRCRGAHFGTYDFTASCNITAAYQSMDHPWCNLAKGMMVLAYGGTGIFLSDGATNVMPVGPHRGDALAAEQEQQNRAVVHAAWRLAHRHIRHSLEGGFYQGWDLHPGQLPVRYATCFGFFLEGFSAAAERLRNFIEKAAQATLVGDVFDDAATGQGLLNYFLRALNSGAIEPSDLGQTGLEAEEVALRSFAKILAARRARLRTG